LFSYTFLELDPFGTPMPYLHDTVYSLRNEKEAFLSITATDVAVLCGPHSNACVKHYHSKSLNNEFTHETGIRILLKRILDSLVEFNFGMEPLVSLSDQHYLKVLVKIKKGDIYSQNSINNIGYISYCWNCGNRIYGKVMYNTCNQCNHNMDYAGPLWLGKLHNTEFLKKMITLNNKREYEDKNKIDKILHLMVNENNPLFPPYFYNLSKLSKIGRKTSVPSINKSLTKLKEAGYIAERTHFSSNSIKTNANLLNIFKLLY